MSSVVDDMEGVSSQTSRRMQEKEETTTEASWTAVAEREERMGGGWNLKGETETLEVTVLWNEEASV